MSDAVVSVEPVRLPEDLVDFVEGGVSVLLGTRDGQNLPECVRAVGTTVAPDRRSLTILLNEAVAARTLENVRGGGPVAITFSRPIDHRTVQLKGRAVGVRAGTEADRGVAERYLSAFTEALYLVGMSRSVVRRLRVWPAVAVDVVVTELFQQTPGPLAGERLQQVR